MYENAFYGYQFSYPPEANVGIEGVIDFPWDEKPENLSYDAFWINSKKLTQTIFAWLSGI